MTIFGKFAKRQIPAVLVLGLLATGIAQAQNSGSGPTQSPATNRASQPQGSTGPVTTGTGGAPASSPQGETAPKHASRAGRLVQFHQAAGEPITARSHLHSTSGPIPLGPAPRVVWSHYRLMS
jgi:hypothetical protein